MKSICRIACRVSLAVAVIAGGKAYEAQGATVETNKAQIIPWDQIGTKAGAGYHGDGLAMTATRDGARLHCVFQKLDGEATREGLWLTSTAANQTGDRFRIVALELGREKATALEKQGEVSVDGQTVRLQRHGVVEEYSVSMDGVRQDFVVTEKPAGAGELRVGLEVTGAEVTPIMGGAELVLKESGRKIAYNRLRATDANGKELAARVEAGSRLAILVDDTKAAYPVRIDPTFSDANWFSMGDVAGTDGQVTAVTTDASGDLFAGGIFSLAGHVTANNVAEWNGTNWLALGSGLNGTVNALATSGHLLYAGGVFTNAGGVSARYIAQWDGTNWSALGSGMNDQVYALACSSNTLYAGGVFTNAGGVAAAAIAQWNGSNWSALGPGISNPAFNPPGQVTALAVSSNGLYAGGSFLIAGGTFSTNVALWSGGNWFPLGAGVSGGTVSALAVSGNALYAGGNFQNAGGAAAIGIARWDGTNWSALNPGGMAVPVYVNGLAASGSNVYAGGLFQYTQGYFTYAIAQWGLNGWTPLESGMNAPPGPLVESGSNLFVGGSFTFVGENSAASHVAEWDGANWHSLGAGLDGDILAFALLGNTLYAGGSFTRAGSVALNGVAQWNGTGWAALGSGFDASVMTLAVIGNTLYAGGEFTNAGAVPVNKVAQWDGTSWSGLSSGMSVGANDFAFVRALAASGGTLYAAGHFTKAGGVSANNIARWNGSGWAALGLGLSSNVFALAASGNTVYAGGLFQRAGLVAANYVAKWSGSGWSALGSGMSGTVNALTVSGTTLYAGGSFTAAGGNMANHIAQWDGSSWTPLGSGVGGGNIQPYSVLSFATSSNMLFVGGIFTNAGSVAANSIARWDGTNWSALGSGLNGGGLIEVWALAVSGNTLYTGGIFATAGGKASGNAAYAVLDLPPNPTVGHAGKNFVLSWPASGSYTLQQSSNLNLPGGWTTSGYAVSNANGTNTVSITNPPGTLFFRLMLP